MLYRLLVSHSPLWSSQSVPQKGPQKTGNESVQVGIFSRVSKLRGYVFAFDPVVLNDIRCFAYLKLRTPTILHIRVTVHAYSIWHHTPSLTGSEASTRSMKFSLRSCQLVNGGKMTTPSKQSRRSLFVFILCLLVLGTINERSKWTHILFLRNLFGS